MNFFQNSLAQGIIKEEIKDDAITLGKKYEMIAFVSMLYGFAVMRVAA